MVSYLSTFSSIETILPHSQRNPASKRPRFFISDFVGRNSKQSISKFPSPRSCNREFVFDVH
ncbi:no significant blast hit [Histoplasma capsulatum G186AR]|uniref:Uncharacterized protein n=1 Tax=Ajellomyces capsulatus TaxID=5037 RepID=A0A8H8D7X9_AJECA|nr:hypothetical protein I7I52_03949 [Histoplasma capsulatum]QSS76291.1 no significant blast hit [Histoplasma capsulatum G186AR]